MWFLLMVISFRRGFPPPGPMGMAGPMGMPMGMFPGPMVSEVRTATNIADTI